MIETFDYAQLNSEAKKYLADVRRSQGRCAPGIFQEVSDKRPLWAGLVGICVIPLFLWIGYTSSKAPWAMAMLQTAGVLVGGWLLWFAVRRKVAIPDSYAGYFFYFDTDRAYIGEGETIRIANILPSAKLVPRSPDIHVVTELDRFALPVPNQVFAEKVADFYHALTWVRDREDGPFAHLASDEAGAVARYMAFEDEAPANLAEADLRIDSMPDRARAVGRSKTGILGLLIWTAIGAAAFAFFFATDGMIQDDMAFAAARDNLGKEKLDKFTGAHGLRDYLLNERNTRNRDEAKVLLAKLYDEPVAQVQNNQNADPELRAGLVALLNSLRGPETPAVSVSVTMLGPQAVTGLSNGLRSRFADGIATAIGKDLIVFGQAPADKPALITIVYSPTQVGAEWTVEIRLKPDDTAVWKASGSTGFGPQGLQPTPMSGFGQTTELPASQTDATGEAVYYAVMLKLIGQAPPKPTVVFNEDW